MSGLRIVRRAFSDSSVKKSLTRILRENVLCSIATVAPGNRAYINTAYFCHSPDLELYFLSDAGSVHSQNLERNASMAMTIFRSDQVWGKPDRGVQLFGRAHVATGTDAKRAERSYGRRFPVYVRYIRSIRPSDRRTGARLRSYRFYRFVPRTVKILDERVFGGGVFVVASVPRRKSAK